MAATAASSGGRCSGAPKTANAWHTEAAKRKAMGIDWMSRPELANAVPPAYSEFIARQALEYLGMPRRYLSNIEMVDLAAPQRELANA